MNVFGMILGLLFLFAGRKFFWLFIGGMGCLVGINFATSLASPVDGFTVIILAVVLGILGAAFAVGFQWAAIVLAGFLGGGYFLMNIFSFWVGQTEFAWWLFLIGGILGILIVAMAFDGALIIITSLIGAMLIIEQLRIDEPFRSISFIVVLVLGILAQCFSQGVFTDKS